jgi:hypothetical protein
VIAAISVLTDGKDATTVVQGRLQALYAARAGGRHCWKLDDDEQLVVANTG